MSHFNNPQPNNNLTSTRHSPKARWDLLPGWIQFITLGFLILSIITVPYSFYSFVENGFFDSDIYGLKKTKISRISELALILNVLNILVAYGYIYQKDWAIKVGITNAIVGILICIFVIITGLLLDRINFRFEIIILIIYQLKLKSIREQWENIKT